MKNRVPGQIIIQMTDRCNARCPQCGMRVTEPFTRSTLDTDAIKTIIDAAARHGVKVISLTGGEPLLDVGRLVEVISYAHSAGIPFIRTGTNGFLFAHHEKDDFEDRIRRLVERLAGTPLRNFWISLDSAVDEVHEQMRGFPGVVAGIEKALPIFHGAGIYPAVNLGINRNIGGETTSRLKREDFGSDADYLEMFYFRYRDVFERFYQRAVDLGFTIANTCYPMSFDGLEDGSGLEAIYGAIATNDIVRFTPAEKQMLFSALISAILTFRSKLRIFSPLCSLEALVRQYRNKPSEMQPYGCRGGVDFFYVNASDGHTYPCGYRGNEDLGELGELDMRRFRPETDSNACRRCDWECFRDPSELYGPILDIFQKPLRFLRDVLKTPGSFSIWCGDLQYYKACDFFDGRKPPNDAQLERFSPAGNAYHAYSDESHPRFNEKLSLN